MPYVEPLTDQQLLEVRNLQQSSQQAEEALSQGLDKLQQGLVESIVNEIRVVEPVSYGPQMASAMENLQALEGFVNQVTRPYSSYSISVLIRAYAVSMSFLNP